MRAAKPSPAGRPASGPAPGAAPGAAPGTGPYFAGCPTRMVLDHVADKWTGLVLGLLARGPRRFNALRRTVDGISPKVLAQVLRRLERDGLATRHPFATVPVTVEYRITALGASLDRALAPVVAWSEAHIAAVLAAQAAFDARPA